MVTRFSLFDLSWHLTSTKNNRNHALTMTSTHTMYELNWSLTYQVMVDTRFSMFDLCWPQMTFDLNQKYTDRLPIMSNLPPKYENGWTLRCWLRVVTSHQQRNIDLATPLMNIKEMQYVINLPMFSTSCQCHQTNFERNRTCGCRVTHILRNRF